MFLLRPAPDHSDTTPIDGRWGLLQHNAVEADGGNVLTLRLCRSDPPSAVDVATVVRTPILESVRAKLAGNEAVDRYRRLRDLCRQAEQDHAASQAELARLERERAEVLRTVPTDFVNRLTSIYGRVTTIKGRDLEAIRTLQQKAEEARLQAVAITVTALITAVRELRQDLQQAVGEDLQDVLGFLPSSILDRLLTLSGVLGRWNFLQMDIPNLADILVAEEPAGTAAEDAA